MSYYSGTYTSVAQVNGLTRLSAAPTQVGTYTALASFPGSADYTTASELATFTIAQAKPSVSVSDTGGTFNGTAFPATAAIMGVSGSTASSLEGVSPSVSYYSGTYTSAAQLSSLTALAGPPIQAGAYTVLASFAGSVDYASGSNLAGFTIAKTLPTVSVSDTGGTYRGAAFPATATVTGVSGSPGSSLEGVSPSISYYSGTYTSAAQLSGLTTLSGAPSHSGAYTVLASFAGSVDYTSSSNLANFTVTQATPAVSVSDTGGTYRGAAFLAKATVTGVSGSPGSSLEGVSPSVSYYSGTYTSAAQLSGLTARVRRAQPGWRVHRRGQFRGKR